MKTFVGIDLGSTTTKAVLLDENSHVIVVIKGMVIHPGDLILGDDDGLICVPRLHPEEVL